MLISEVMTRAVDVIHEDRIFPQRRDVTVLAVERATAEVLVGDEAALGVRDLHSRAYLTHPG